MAVGIANKVQQKFVEELQSQATRQGADHPTGNHGAEQGLGNQNMQQGTDQLSTQSPSIQQTTSQQPTVEAHRVGAFQQAMAAPAPADNVAATNNIYVRPPQATAPVEPGTRPFNNPQYFHRVAPVQGTETAPLNASSYNPSQEQTLGDKIINNMISLDQHVTMFQGMAQNAGTQSGQLGNLLQTQMDVMKVTETAKISSTASNRTSQGFESLEKIQ